MINRLTRGYGGYKGPRANKNIVDTQARYDNELLFFNGFEFPMTRADYKSIMEARKKSAALRQQQLDYIDTEAGRIERPKPFDRGAVINSAKKGWVRIDMYDGIPYLTNPKPKDNSNTTKKDRPSGVAKDGEGGGGYYKPAGEHPENPAEQVAPVAGSGENNTGGWKPVWDMRDKLVNTIWLPREKAQELLGNNDLSVLKPQWLSNNRARVNIYAPHTDKNVINRSLSHLGSAYDAAVNQAVSQAEAEYKGQVSKWETAYNNAISGAKATVNGYAISEQADIDKANKDALARRKDQNETAISLQSTGGNW